MQTQTWSQHCLAFPGPKAPKHGFPRLLWRPGQIRDLGGCASRPAIPGILEDSAPSGQCPEMSCMPMPAWGMPHGHAESHRVLTEGQAGGVGESQGPGHSWGTAKGWGWGNEGHSKSQSCGCSRELPFYSHGLNSPALLPGMGPEKAEGRLVPRTVSILEDGKSLTVWLLNSHSAQGLQTAPGNPPPAGPQQGKNRGLRPIPAFGFQIPNCLPQ